MGRLQNTGAALAMATLLVSCVRFELDGESDTEVDVGSSALRISNVNSVVLCPIAATVEPEGNVSIVWAGYPADDDRLQLMHARVSSMGALIQEPRGLAQISDELALLSLQHDGGSFEVNAIGRDAEQALRIEFSDSFHVLGAYRDTLAADERDGVLEALTEEHCQETVFTSEARLQIRRTQVDGELPLFVESFSL
tara:strand:+ start:36409 stop:36996 length:588 start_codon:yes stop_codon:yes gene_type:complete